MQLEATNTVNKQGALWRGCRAAFWTSPLPCSRKCMQQLLQRMVTISCFPPPRSLPFDQSVVSVQGVHSLEY